MSRYCGTLLVLVLALLAETGSAQLRPRRVGTNAMGEQEDAGDGGPEATMVDPMAAQLGGSDAADILKNMMKGLDMENNPMLQQLASANPELAEMMANPEKMQEQIEQVTQMLSSGEGAEAMKGMMEQMQEVLTNPEKLAEGLQQLNDNPQLKGLADSVPGLRDILDDPEKMAEQVQKTAELFGSLNDPDKLAELTESLGDMGDLEGAQEKIMNAMKTLMGDGDNDALAEMLGGLGGGDGEDLRERVRENLANMMQGGGLGGMGGEEPGAEIDDQF